AELAVTRALGDRCMKSESPLIAEPEMTEIVLTDDDEFMIIGCDGIWDVMSNEEAVSLVRKALRLHTSDNLTAINEEAVTLVQRQLMQDNDHQRCSLHLHTSSGAQNLDVEEAQNRNRSLLEDNED
ncbi:phosphatase 2C 13, partial [Tanacetum coccineum]